MDIPSYVSHARERWMSGDQAPEFKAKDVTYHDIDLAGYRGRNTSSFSFTGTAVSDLPKS
jgi:hypothetical protein